jgi:4-amino-4-deoxy-L-arabinose transferase-like glycosyltransferase
MTTVECREPEIQVTHALSEHVPSPVRKPRSTSPVLCLLALAILIRVSLLMVHGLSVMEGHDRDDSIVNETTNIAFSLASGHGFGSPMFPVAAGDGWTGPSAWIPPVYPYFCGGVFKLLGRFSQPSLQIIILAQCLFSAFTVIPIVAIGKRTVGPQAAYGAAFLWAAFPWFSKWAITWIWDTDLTALLCAWLFAYALWLAEPAGSKAGYVRAFTDSGTSFGGVPSGGASYKSWAGFGALWGFTMLVNPALLPLLPLLPVSACWLASRHSKTGRPWLRSAVIACLFCILAISPWLVRNRMVFGQWTFIRSNFGFEFAIGNFHGGTGRARARHHPTGNLDEFADYKNMGELAYVRWKFDQAKKFVRQYPGEFLTLTAERTLWFWDGHMMHYHNPINPIFLPWSFPWLSALSVPAVWLALKRRVHGWQMFLGTVILYPIPYYITSNQTRFRHALEPLMLLLIAYAGVELWALWPRFNKPPLGGASETC